LRDPDSNIFTRPAFAARLGFALSWQFARSASRWALLALRGWFFLQALAKNRLDATSTGVENAGRLPILVQGKFRQTWKN
jgi:hypothetical protein